MVPGVLRRIFWFGVGAGVTVFVVVKVRSYVRSATPEAVGHRVAGSVAGVGEAVRDFVDRARAAMAEREAELRDAIGQPPPTEP